MRRGVSCVYFLFFAGGAFFGAGFFATGAAGFFATGFGAGLATGLGAGFTTGFATGFTFTAMPLGFMRAIAGAEAAGFGRSEAAAGPREREFGDVGRGAPASGMVWRPAR